MAKQHHCKDCEFFKVQDNLCSYYESNTYSDTPSCSKFKNEQLNGEDSKEEKKIDKGTSAPLVEIATKENEFNRTSGNKEGGRDSVPVDSDRYDKEEKSSEGKSVIQKVSESESNNNDYEEIVTSKDENYKNTDSPNYEVSISNSDNIKRGPKVRQITDTDYYKPESMFSHPFSFDGRIRRTEYGLSFILFYVGTWIIGFIVGLAMSNYIYYSPDGEYVAKLVCYILLIPAYWFLFAQGAKRCHDRNNSGWYQLIPFYWLWMLFADGDAGENAYGMPPKASYGDQRVLNNGELDDGSGTIDVSYEEEENEEQAAKKEVTANNASTVTQNGVTTNETTSPKKDNSMLFIIIAGLLTLVPIVVLCLTVSSTNSNNQDLGSDTSIESTSSDNDYIGNTFDTSISDDNNLNSGFDDDEGVNLDDDNVTDDEEDNSEDIENEYDQDDDYSY